MRAARPTLAPIVAAAGAAAAGTLAAGVLAGLARDALSARQRGVAAGALAGLARRRGGLVGATGRRLGRLGARPPAPGELRASVVIPALNEAPRIAAAIGAIRAALASWAEPGEVEVVVVDDGSTDRTADAALAAGADQVVVHPFNRGKGAAVRSGLLASRGRAVGFTDADLAYDPARLVAALALVEDGWDIVVGSRRRAGRAWPAASGDAGRLRALGSRAINLLAAGVLLSRPHDTQCGLKAFRADAARIALGLGRIEGFAFDMEVFHLAQRFELSLLEVPVRARSSDRTTTVRLARDGLRLVVDLWRIRRYARTGAYDLPADLPAG